MPITIAEANRKVIKYTAIFSSAAVFAYWVYWNWYGHPSSEKRKELEQELQQALNTVRDLEDQLMHLERESTLAGDEKREIRLWVDGAFDMMHYGHMNAFRQARALGTYLIAGVNSTETITICKGAPVCSDKERVDTVRGCRWVDEVVEGVPYVLDDELLTDIVKKYRIDYVVHGDDPCIVNGRNAYEAAIKMGKYLTIPRTEGVSTTDIVGRMLLMTTEHHERSEAPADDASEDFTDKLARHIQADGMRKSNFLTTSRIIRLFGAGLKAPKVDDKVVYIAGSWDMFHAGHIEALEKAKKLGTYVIVGIHNDQVVNKLQGMNLPIMSLHERTLSVLGCKWVDDVLIDAPYVITQEMMSSLRISIVAQSFPEVAKAEVLNQAPPMNDPYALPRQLGILQTIFTEYNLSALDFVERIQLQKDRYAERFARKMQAENDFYKTKYSL